MTVSKAEPVLVHKGKASYYADFFDGRRTASGERFSQRKLTAASRTLPLGSRVLVTNADNGRSVEVVINDRGPYVKGRVIDLSKMAARELDMIEEGVVNVRVEARTDSKPVFPRNRRPREEAPAPMVAELPPLPGAEEAGDGVPALPVAADFPIEFPELGASEDRMAEAQ
ncbi:septal ring lytic transglycosylase RlpA family protein [Azospirillum rugosum]|uniref:Endolytic peptidoglycan transglycosylase RlpA n=1 Tax=Azospirillum rugosum TaxID=416170 RepID=A0ABS4SG29_9PROT|nr:septal ring lytic transglycosylase RlpA family protein [Azospirillum rugosum]MBP2291525.1 rare lipoprotein A (peptidoglycan hydrolase) [Azospirillum rugosum]MDQ0525313.1 rare lipoprotein A (peptidoglycan hydrolase) [Azospirillum rugosum]